MTETIKKQAIAKWKKDVWDNAQGVDPDNEIDWGNLAFGFFMGMGFSVRDAYKLQNMAENEGLV